MLPSLTHALHIPSPPQQLWPVSQPQPHQRPGGQSSGQLQWAPGTKAVGVSISLILWEREHHQLGVQSRAPTHQLD